MARKVNTRFLIILTLVVGGGLVGVLLAQKLLNRKDADTLVQDAEMHLAADRHQDALISMQRAINARPDDPALRVRLGDMFLHLVQDDRGAWPKVFGSWHSALEVDPSYLPALERLLKIQRVQAEGSRSSQSFRDLRETASRIVKIQPDNYEIAGLVHQAVIEPWVRGIPAPLESIEEAVAALEELIEKDPSSPSHPYWVAQAKLHLAREQRGRERTRLRDEALAVIDAALERQPDNAETYWRAGMIHQAAAAFTEDKEEREQQIAHSRTLIQRGRELATGEEQRYVEIMTTAAQLALQNQDFDQANAILQEVADARPDDQFVRLHQARVLAITPGRRNDAIKLLETPVQNEEITPERLFRDPELATLLQLVELRINALSDLEQGSERDAAIQRIEEECARIQHRLGEQPRVLRLRGDFALARGDLVEAVSLYERTREVAQLEGQAGEPEFYDMLFRLSRAYRQLGQTGQAKSLLEQVLRQYPAHLPSRIHLTELLLMERDYAAAERQLELLEEHGATPEQLRLLRLNIALGSDDKATSGAIFSELPEETPAQMRAKADMALRMNQRDEAIRLLEAARRIDPESVNVRVLAMLYAADKQNDKALQVIEEGIAANPNDRTLAVIAEQLRNPDPDRIVEFRRQSISEIADEFTRELQLFDLERDQGNHEAALTHLNNAARLRPDDLNVKEALFQVALQQRDWDRATQLADELAAADHDKAGGALVRFRLALARGESARAVELARETVRRLPHFAQSYVALGQAYAAQGRFEAAITEFRQALERQGSNPDALRGIIASYYALQQPDNARRYIEQARRLRPNDAFFVEAELNHMQHYGDPTQALPAREAAVKRDPENPRARLELARLYRQAARYEETERQNSQAAAQHLQRSQAILRECIEKWPDELQFYTTLAEVLVDLDQREEAEKTLKALAARDAWKDRAAPHQLLAEFHARLGNIPQAEYELRQAMIKSDGDMSIRLQLSNFLSQIGKINEALAELESVRDDPAAQRQRVDILLRAGQIDMAETALKDAIAANPQALDLKAHLGLIYLATERLDEAMDIAGEVLAREGENVVALLTRGRVRLIKGEVDAAIADLTKVVEISSQNVDARVALADARRQRADYTGAIREMEEAVKIQPLNKSLRLRLFHLYRTAQPSPRWIDAERLLRETRQMPQFAQDPELALLESQMWRARGQHARAVTSIEEAMKLAPNNAGLQNEYYQTLIAARQHRRVLDETRTLAAGDEAPFWVHHARALAHKGMGDRSAALGEFEKAISRAEAEQNGAATAQLIQSLGREIGVTEAIRHIGDRINTDPAWQLLALQLYHASGESAAAVALLEQMDQTALTDVQRAQYLRMAGLIYSSTRPLPMANEAYDAYIQLLDLNPNAVDVLNNLAYLLVDTMRPARPEQAVTYSQKAMDLLAREGRIEPIIQDTHGWVLTHLPDRLDEGINVLSAIVNRGADFPDVYYHLGEAYLKKESADLALTQLRRAQAVIADAEAQGMQQYDELKLRVEDAIYRAEALARQKAASAQ